MDYILKRKDLIRETKNTNYKMHKGKKGWIVSYSLLTLLLGGLLMSNNTANVSAAKIDTSMSQANNQVNNHLEFETGSFKDAKKSAIEIIKFKATEKKQNLLSNKEISIANKEKLTKNIDTIASDAENEINSLTDLPTIKATVTQITNELNEVGSAALKTASSTTKLKKVTAKNLHNGQKNKAVVKKENKKQVKQENIDLKRTINLAATANLNKQIKSEKVVTDSVPLEKNKAEQKAHLRTNEMEASEAVATDESNYINVAAAVDKGRDAFNQKVKQPVGKTPTSVNVEIPEQVLNPDKSISRDVTTLAELAECWSNAAVTYINITADITYTPGVTFGKRAAGASVVINGNGHKIDLRDQKFLYDSISYKKAPVTYLTLTNAKFEQGFTGKTGNVKALVFTNDGSNLAVNIDNVRLSASNVSELHAIRGVMAKDSLVTFSGKNEFIIANEVVRGAGTIKIANNSSVEMVRTEGAISGDDPADSDQDDADDSTNPVDAVDSESGEFNFNSKAKEGSIGFGNLFVMGDGSTNIATTLNGVSADFPALYHLFYGIKIGDNVSWKQTGFEYFINGKKSGSSGSNASFVFGQNFKLDCPSTTKGGAIQLTKKQSAVFNAGTTLNINQRAANKSIISVLGTSSVTFISPKELHLSISDSSNTPAAARKGVIDGPGTVKINNSSLMSWSGSNSSTVMPEGEKTARFRNMTITNGKATVDNEDGMSQSSNIVSKETREIRTSAITPGKIAIQYVNQKGENIGDAVTLPLGKENYKDVYVGQYIPLVSDDIVNKYMPKGYMWALGSQINKDAAADHQSGGSTLDSSDNGDEAGQPNIAIVPMDEGTYTYKVYVYGTKQNVTYRYVDVNHPDRVLKALLSTGAEDINGLATANYGNTIDWTNKYYTETNVPSGYQYKVDAENQATTTLVAEDNEPVTIYVEGIEQEITPAYVDKDGRPITPINPVTIKGKTGDTITIPPAPNAFNLAVEEVLLNDIPVEIGSTFEMPNQKDPNEKVSLTYKYRSLAEDKSSAMQEIRDHLKTVRLEISSDITLTDADKALQTTSAEKAALTVINNIDQTTDLNELNKVVKDGKEKISNCHQPKALLEEQKATAKQELDNKAQEVKGQIDADKNLTEAEKNKQKGDIDKAVQEAKSNIDKADKAQGVEEAVEAGKTAIAGAHKPGTELPTQQEAAKQELDNKAQEVKGQIDADKNLTEAEKNKQKGDIEKAVQEAKSNIDKADKAQGVEEAVEAGKTAIADAHKPGTELPTQQEAAKQELDNKAQEVKGQIDADKNLTEAEKNKQKGDIEKAVQEAKSNIDKADKAQGVEEAVEAGKTAIADAHKPGTELPTQQEAAKQELDNKAQEVKGQIDADKNLTEAEKNKQKGDIEKAVQEAKSNIDKADKAQGVEEAVEAGKTAIADAHKPGTELPTQQEAAKQELDNKAQEVKGQIDADKNLTEAEKNKQKGDIEKAVQEAKSNIDKADKAQGVEEAVEAGKTAIADAHKPGTELPTQQEAAKQELDNKAQEVKGQIDADKNLTEAEKNKQKGDIEKAVQEAKSNIDKADKAQGVEEAVEAGKTAIADAHKPGTELPTQQEAAKQELDNKAQEVKGQIDADKNLTEAEKVTQTANVDLELGKAQNAVDRAKNAQEIYDCEASGIIAIDKQYVPGKPSTSGSNDSDSNGSGSNGSNSDDSDSNSSGSNGSGSNDSDSNGSGSNGSGSEDSDSNGSGSNGSGSNDSDSNDSGSNGSGSNDSDSNDSGSNGSSSNDSDSNGSGSNGSGSEDSDSNGSGSNGSGSNDSDSNGSGSNGSSSNDSDSNGSGSNGSSSNDSDSNGSGSNGSGSEDSDSNGSGSNGSGSDDSDANGSGSDSSSSNGSNDQVKAVDRKLRHNAYFYNKEGKRANLLVVKKGSTVATFEISYIGGREFYLTQNGLYVAVNNFRSRSRRLKHNAFIYNRFGHRCNSKVLKENTTIGTYGDPIKILDVTYYIIGTNRYVKAANFLPTKKEANNVLAQGVTTNAVIEHDAYIYNVAGERINQIVLMAGSKVTTGETKIVDGRQFVEIASGQYVANNNVNGKARKLTANADIYNKYGIKTGKLKIKNRNTVQTYGSEIVIKGQAYFSIGNNKFVKKMLFKE